MADYYPLIAKAVDGLSERGPASRRTVYERARHALIGQLRTLEPPLTDAEIERERVSLDTAIARVESEQVAEDALAAKRQEAAEAEAVAPPAAAMPASAEAVATDAAAAARISRRPAEMPPIRRGGRRGRPGLLLAGLLAAAVPIGTLAWLWRDGPRTIPPETVAPVAAAPPVAESQNKIADRIGGAPAPGAARPAGPDPSARSAAAASPSAPAGTSQPAPARPAAPAAAEAAGAPADLAVAQRAILVEENAAEPSQPTLVGGRALWRLDAVNAGQGQRLETAVRAAIEVPDRALRLDLVFRRNLDPALPASHTIELAFSSTRPDSVVKDIGRPSMRLDENGRGLPLAGLPVPVKDNLFLVGLSDLPADIDRNAELLTGRNWLEIPIRYASGRQALLLVAKGVSGERVLDDAFRQWREGAPARP